MKNSDDLEDVRNRIKERSRDGEACVWGYDERPPSIVFWDDKTESWLMGAHVEGSWNFLPKDEFPTGLEIGVVWGDAEFIPVEETALHHASYGLDRAREGYGKLVR